MFNVHYDDNGQTKQYLLYGVDMDTAKEYTNKFIEKYVGKPYPNGKGHYGFKNVTIGLHINGDETLD